jgi:hypothetical protein
LRIKFSRANKFFSRTPGSHARYSSYMASAGRCNASGKWIRTYNQREEDQRLIQQFGDNYIAYMKRVPRMNIFLGVARLVRQRQ